MQAGREVGSLRLDHDDPHALVESRASAARASHSDGFWALRWLGLHSVTVCTAPSRTTRSPGIGSGRSPSQANRRRRHPSGGPSPLRGGSWARRQMCHIAAATTAGLWEICRFVGRSPRSAAARSPSVARSATTSPTTTTAGERTCSWTAVQAAFSRVVTVVRWRGVQPDSMKATGVSVTGRCHRPRGRCGDCVHAHEQHEVASRGASRAASSACVAAGVRGSDDEGGGDPPVGDRMPAAAGTDTAEVTPAPTSTVCRAPGSAAPPRHRVQHERVTTLSRTTTRPARACSTRTALICSWVPGGCPVPCRRRRSRRLQPGCRAAPVGPTGRRRRRPQRRAAPGPAP